MLPSVRRRGGVGLSTAAMIAATVRAASPFKTKLPSPIARRRAPTGVTAKPLPAWCDAAAFPQGLDTDAAVGGWWLFGEVLAPSALLGIAVIVLGVFILAGAMEPSTA